MLVGNNKAGSPCHVGEPISLMTGLQSVAEELESEKALGGQPDPGCVLDANVDLISISQLVHLARDGDRQAHSEICRQIQPGLTRMAENQLHRNLRAKISPSDIVQATMTRMICGFADFRSSSSAEFYSWLNTILKNEIRTTRRDLLRQRRDVRREQSTAISEPAEVTGTGQTPSSILSRDETIHRFRKVLQHLPQDYATVIQLRGIDERPFSEVAARMNRSVEAVSKLFHRALVSLQKELSKLDEFPT